MPCSYNFRRVLIEVVTIEDLKTRESFHRMLDQIKSPTSMNSQFVEGEIVAREDTLEQIAAGLSSSFGDTFGYRDCSKTHQELLQSACISMGMDV